MPSTGLRRVHRIGRLAGPAFAGQIAVPLYGLIDTAIVGRLGTEELSGVALATTVLTVVAWCSLFLTNATLVDVARARAAGATSEAQQAVAVALVAAVTLGLAVAIGLGATASSLTSLTAAAPAVEAHAAEYLRFSALGIPGLLVGYVVHGHLQGCGRLGASLVLSVAAAALNVGLELALVPGLGLGVVGSALGTTFAVSIVAGSGLIVIHRADAAAPLRFVTWPRLRNLFGEGIRQAAGSAAIVVTVATSTTLAGGLGSASLAAHHLALQLYVFLAAGLNAIAVAAQILVADGLGRGSSRDAATWTRTALVIGVACSTSVGVVLSAARTTVASVFSQDPDVVAVASRLVVLVAIQQVPGAAAYITDATLLARRRAGRLALNNLAATTAFVASALLLRSLDVLTAGTLWGALVIWMSVRAALNLHAGRPITSAPARSSTVSVEDRRIQSTSGGGCGPGTPNAPAASASASCASE
jgi:putative MATE family efflux protein